MYNITSKLNSTFGTIGKVAADKMFAKVVGKTQAFALARRINWNVLSCSEFEHVYDILTFKIVFSPHIEWKFIGAEIPVFFFFWLPLFEDFRF